VKKIVTQPSEHATHFLTQVYWTFPVDPPYELALVGITSEENDRGCSQFQKKENFNAQYGEQKATRKSQLWDVLVTLSSPTLHRHTCLYNTALWIEKNVTAPDGWFWFLITSIGATGHNSLVDAYVFLSSHTKPLKEEAKIYAIAYNFSLSKITWQLVELKGELV
jgi:hypothetical protein